MVERKNKKLNINYSLFIKREISANSILAIHSCSVALFLSKWGDFVSCSYINSPLTMNVHHHFPVNGHTGCSHFFCYHK